MVSPQVLLRAQSARQHQDADLSDLLRLGYGIDGNMLLQARADHLGVGLFDQSRHMVDTDALAALGPATCLKHTLLPTRDRAGKRLLVCARPDRLDRVRNTLPRVWADAPLVLTDEATVQQTVAALGKSVLVAAASARVPARESCRTWGRHPRRRLACTAVAVILCLALVIAYPFESLTALVTWACFTLIVSALQKTAALVSFLTRPRRPGPVQPPTNAPLPRVSVLVPLFRERNVATVLVERLSRLTYPKALLDVVLVLEETDTLTRDVLADVTLPPWMRMVVVPDGQPRTKPRAMNYALDCCRGDIIGIWDAEDAPAPEQIDRVAARFLTAPDDLVCLQGVLDYYNPRQSWLARCFTIEYATWFRVMLPGMARLGFAIPLGGTTLFFRRDALEELGGWDAHNVTEDADLGFRLSRHGYRTEMIDTTTGEEANCRIWPWIKQRSRWLKGYMVTWIVHMRRPRVLIRQMGWWKFLGMQTHFITALSQFLLAPLLWSFWLMPLGVTHPMEHVLSRDLLLMMGKLFLGVELLTMGAAIYAVRGAEHRHLWPWVPSLHLYFPLGCIAAYKALWELITAPFYWDKTEHGLSLHLPSRGLVPHRFDSARIELQTRHESL
ncbi:glycosyltransferase [Lutimaribacter degradans]|uniref:glycosyltransferase n=1 Tax=Lutimaribacter degradans TaxID=2945989 RepID=UPI00203F1929|nr:glycosyltransferase [Lutimaribacter sp. EGI FJ00013]